MLASRLSTLAYLAIAIAVRECIDCYTMRVVWKNRAPTAYLSVHYQQHEQYHNSCAQDCRY